MFLKEALPLFQLSQVMFWFLEDTARQLLPSPPPTEVC
jgi:hypothetical protein